MKRLALYPLAIAAYPLAAFAVWVTGRLYRHLEDPELVARLRRLNDEPAPPLDTTCLYSVLAGIEASADHIRRDLNKAAGQ